jgi:branched-chain amino acid aminotransferase
VTLTSLDGALTPTAEARIPVTDEGLLRGDGVFEVMRLYGGVPFALEDHMARLATSAANLRLDADLGALRRELGALLEAAGPVEGLLRLVLTRGGRRLAMVEPLPGHPSVARVMTVTYAPTRILDNIKSLSYAGNMLAVRLAKEAGFDEALLTTPHGRVLEGPTWSFFWVRDGRLYTPPLDDHVLPSITRARVLEVAGGEERATPLDDARAADEAFIASTVREVLPIAAIDDAQLPAAPGPVTLAASQALRRRIQEELAAAPAPWHAS